MQDENYILYSMFTDAFELAVVHNEFVRYIYDTSGKMSSMPRPEMIKHKFESFASDNYSKNQPTYNYWYYCTLSPDMEELANMIVASRKSALTVYQYMFFPYTDALQGVSFSGFNKQVGELVSNRVKAYATQLQTMFRETAMRSNTDDSNDVVELMQYKDTSKGAYEAYEFYKYSIGPLLKLFIHRGFQSVLGECANQTEMLPINQFNDALDDYTKFMRKMNRRLFTSNFDMHAIRCLFGDQIDKEITAYANLARGKAIDQPKAIQTRAYFASVKTRLLHDLFNSASYMAMTRSPSYNEDGRYPNSNDYFTPIPEVLMEMHQRYES